MVRWHVGDVVRVLIWFWMWLCDEVWWIMGNEMVGVGEVGGGGGQVRWGAVEVGGR